jgi:hypothetical protein
LVTDCVVQILVVVLLEELVQGYSLLIQQPDPEEKEELGV